MRPFAVVGLVGALLGLSLTSADAASSSARWSIVPTVNHTRANGILSAVSCPESTICIAVGDHRDPDGDILPLAERWDGTAWSVQHIAPPPGALITVLDDVACVASMRCMAVGHFFGARNSALPVAESWDGSAWLVLPTPHPQGVGDTVLKSLACASADECIAVGYSTDRSAPYGHTTLSERWDGASWSIQETPGNATENSELDGVACPARDACMAVGYSDGGTLSERWDGRSWSILSMPTLIGEGQLFAVSCSTPAACTAVGSGRNASSDFGPLAERWDGTAWSVQNTPRLGDLHESSLTAVACPASSACFAVGYKRFASDEPRRILAERWNGKAWATQEPPVPQQSDQRGFNGIACSGKAACIAVGFQKRGYDDQTLAERWDGRAWFLMHPQNRLGALDSFLTDVACAARGVCLAVGSIYGSHGSHHGLAERWDGSAWSIEDITGSAGVGPGELSGVACSSTDACTVVGHAGRHLGFRTPVLAWRWNGTTWSTQAIHKVPGTEGMRLDGVACPTATDCMAVGFAFLTVLPVAERWDGAEWRGETMPVRPNARYNQARAVSCSSPSACTAVGLSINRGDTDVALVERWDGTSWSLQRAPRPANGSDTDFSGVACPSANDCIAVGRFWRRVAPFGEFTLAEHWDGTTWSIMPTPRKLSLAHWSRFESVACTSGRSCLAVGSSDEGTLSERWDGTRWSIVPTPNPAGGGFESLQSVACPAPAYCNAVGGYDADGISVTLGERYSSGLTTSDLPSATREP